MSGLGQAMHPILNYVEFRTNPEPYMVQGVVHAEGNRMCSIASPCTPCGAGLRFFRLPRPSAWVAEPTSRIYGESRFRRDALNHSAIPP
jgi:hypothetical protein